VPMRGGDPLAGRVPPYLMPGSVLFAPHFAARLTAFDSGH
jgi:hypothetical protein